MRSSNEADIIPYSVKTSIKYPGDVMHKNRIEKMKVFFKHMGAKSFIVSICVFLLTIAATGAGGYLLFRSTKKKIYLQGEVNAIQAAKDFDNYLLVRKNTVILAGHVVDEMIREERSNSEIIEYLTAESLSIKKTIDKKKCLNRESAWRLIVC